jgi:hypothetical protein
MGAFFAIAAVVGFLYLQGRERKSGPASGGEGTRLPPERASGAVEPPPWSPPLPPQPDSQPVPQPEPQPQPQPDPLLAKVNAGLDWAKGGHPDIHPPATIVWSERKIAIDPSGYSYGIDIYSDATTAQTGQHIGLVYVVSSTKESSIWSYGSASITAVRDKLRYYADVLRGVV